MSRCHLTDDDTAGTQSKMLYYQQSVEAAVQANSKRNSCSQQDYENQG